MFVENYGPVAENEATSGIKVLYLANIENIYIFINRCDIYLDSSSIEER